MYKSYLLICLLLTILLFGAFQGKGFIQSSSEKLGSKLVSIDQSVEVQNWDKALAEINAFKLDWEKTKKGWAVLLHHQEIDNIDISLARVEKYIENKNLALSLGEISALVLLISHVAEMDMFSLENIL